jgi:hypothetical protein
VVGRLRSSIRISIRIYNNSTVYAFASFCLLRSVSFALSPSFCLLRSISFVLSPSFCLLRSVSFVLSPSLCLLRSASFALSALSA